MELKSLAMTEAFAGLRLFHFVERALEAAGVGLFGLRQRLEPLGDFLEAFLARGAGHGRIHVGVFVRFTGNGCGEVVGGGTDRQARGRIANGLEIFEVAVSMARLAFGGRAEDGGGVVEAFNVGLLCEVKIAAVGLALAGERLFEVLFGLAAFEL